MNGSIYTMQQWTLFLRNAFSKGVVFVRACVIPQVIQGGYKRITVKRVMLFVGAGISFVVISVVVINVVWALVLPIPIFGQLENNYVDESTKIYDRSGKVLLYDTKGTMRQTIVTLDNISPYLINATVAIEDDDFFEHSGDYWLEPMRLFILDSKQAKIIASKENLPAKRDFLKKIGSNPLLRDRALLISWQNPWKILADFPMPVAVGDRDSASCSDWLRGQESNVASLLKNPRFSTDNALLSSTGKLEFPRPLSLFES